MSEFDYPDLLTATIDTEPESENVGAEAAAAYNALIAALDEADYMVQRVVAAYDASLAHLKESRFESSAALEILAESNRPAEKFALSVHDR